MNLTEKELESAKDFLGYIAKYNISKSDAIFLSEFYINKKKKMNFSEGSEYEQNQIVPVFKKYGISFIKRASVTIAIKKCIHLTDSNFPSEQLPSSWQELNKTENIKIEKVKQKKEEPKVVLQNKQEKPTVATADKVNKTMGVTKPKGKQTGCGTLIIIGIICAAIYFMISVFGWWNAFWETETVYDVRDAQTIEDTKSAIDNLYDSFEAKYDELCAKKRNDQLKEKFTRLTNDILTTNEMPWENENLSTEEQNACVNYATGKMNSSARLKSLAVQGMIDCW